MPLPALALPLIGAGIGYLATRSSNAAAAREAQKNRDFQERMSSTAHAREVADLRSAGLNPILSASRGASTPGGATADVRDAGEGISRGIASALAIRQAKAQADLTESQALLARTQAFDVQTSAPMRYGLIEAQRLVAEADLNQRRELLPSILAKAQAEVESTLSSARAGNARAVLDEFARERAMSEAEVAKAIGEFGPWVRLLIELRRGMR